MTLLYFVFLLSGFSALVYQVIWQRLLSLSAGVDAISVSIIVSSFLAGLGVGSLMGSIVADRLRARQAILAFAGINLAIAAFALASRWILYDLVFVALPAVSVSRPAALATSFLTLLLPTTAMGLSLPVLTRAVVVRMDRAAESISWLYGVNTLGAALGALVGGVYLAGTFGYEGTLRIGAALNAAAGLIALAVFWRGSEMEPDEPAPAATRFPWSRLSIHDWSWFGLVTVSGLVVISLEMIWFRVFEVIFMGRAYAFSVVLALFLLFDAAGALVGARLAARIADPRRIFFLLQGAIVSLGGLLLWAAALGMQSDPDALRHWTEVVDHPRWVETLLFPAAVIGPPAFLVGIYFPVVQKAVQRERSLVGTRTALIDFGIVLGNSAGGLLTGLVLLSVLGAPGTLRLLAALALVFTAGAVFRGTTAVRLGAIACGAALVALLVLFPRQDDFWIRINRVPPSLALQSLVGEDATGVAVVVSRPNRSGENAQLLIRGHPQGSIDPFYPIHGLLGSIGSLLHPDPRQILIVGLGSAGTAYAAGVHPATERIDVVEITAVQREVLEALLERAPIAALETVLRDPRYRIIEDDGRRLLALSPARYDIIEADPILPGASHSGLLNSVEYFELVRSRLEEGGLLVHWISTPRVERTILSVFPHAIRLGDIMVASDAPIPFDRRAVFERLREEEIQNYLSAGSLDVATSFARASAGGRLRLWGPDSPRAGESGSLNTDLFPRDEYERFVR
ncbi:MAG: hypothetical protein O7A09_03360 [Proteobacteria bacterium]|nr:hypothetical protein [Pseudomonadota bacterium]